jgi:hypothetical protein
MCTISVPRTRGPDHLVACGEQPGGTRKVLTWGIHSDGQLVCIILGGEFDIATAPGLDRQLSPLVENRQSPSPGPGRRQRRRTRREWHAEGCSCGARR